MFCTWVAESSQRRPGPWTSGKKHRMLPFHACPSTCGQSWTSPFAPSTRTTCTFELDWGPHAVECEQDPSVKDVLMLLHERSHELSAQIVLLLQSFMSTVGSKVLHPKQTKFTARPIWQQTRRTNKGPEQKWLLWRAWLWRHLKKCSTDRPPVGKLSSPGQLARFQRGVPSLASPIRPLGASMYATPSGTLSKSSLFLQPPPCLLKKIQKWGPPLKTHSTNSEILRFHYR